MEWDSIVGAVDERTGAEIVEDSRLELMRAEEEKALDDIQYLVDAGVRIREIEMLGYGCRYAGRRAVTKAEAARFREHADIMLPKGGA